MTNWTELKRLAESIKEGCGLQGADAEEAMFNFECAATPETILALIAENERLSEMANMLADDGISISDERDQLRDEVEALRELLRDSCEAIRHGEFSTGICCCGSSVDSHGFGDGHSPVDEGDYYASGLIERIDSALKPNQ